MAARIAGVVDTRTCKIVSTLDIGRGRKIHRSVSNLAQHRAAWGWLFDADAAGTLVPFDWTETQGLKWPHPDAGPTVEAAQTVEVWLVSVAKRT